MRIPRIRLTAFLAAVFIAAAPAARAVSPLSGFEAMDADRDGKVTRDEHAAAARRMFVAMDRNKDGKVTAAEMAGAHERVAGRKAKAGELSAAEKIKAIDTDGDGVLAAAEHAAGSRTMFDAMDSDRSGALDKAEFDAGHAKMLRR